MSDIVLSREELESLTGYKLATKQLNYLHEHGFGRARIDRHGKVILERAHFDAVSRGELHTQRKGANLSHFKRAA